MIPLFFVSFLSSSVVCRVTTCANFHGGKCATYIGILYGHYSVVVSKEHKQDFFPIILNYSSSNCLSLCDSEKTDSMDL